MYLVTANMTSVWLWEGDEITVQVLQSNDDELMVTICEPGTSKLFTISLDKNIEAAPSSEALKKLIIDARHLNVTSTAGYK